MHNKKIPLIILFIGICFESSLANTYTVTTTADAGAGSLRQAITDVNSIPGNHIIAFNIPNTDLNYDAVHGVWKITLLSTLPIIMRSNLLIDGTTQTTNQGNTNPNGPEIMIDGNHAFGSDFAFHLYNVTNVVVQGFIIGRFTVGIEISGSNSSYNIIRGNYIGCNWDATDTLSNTHGIEILAGPHHNMLGGSTAADRNIFSGNNHTGIRVVNSNYNVIKGNYVGLNRSGNAALRNYDGISIEGSSKFNMIGGYTAAERNYVSGNDAYGIPVFGGGCYYNIIAGNYIGTDISGTIAIPNTYGVLCDDGASYNIIGGRKAGAGNLISGNSGYGIFLYNPGTEKDSVIGNLIGTNVTGNASLPNANGVVIDGPSYKHYLDSNVISGNSQNGIDIHIGGSDSNVIVRNYIGIDFTATTAIPNVLDGVRIGEGPRHNFIGMPGKGNVIAYNGGNGITVMTAAELYNTFTENSMFNNGGLGIDLYPAGPTANDAGDADTGPNDLLNFPVIDSMYFIGGQAVIYGHLDVPSPANTKVELFIAVPDFTGYGEGWIFLGRTHPLPNGNWRDTVTGVSTTDFITSTATDNNGSTSEFSFCYPYPPVIVVEYDNHPVRISTQPNPFSDFTQIVLSGDVIENTKCSIELFDVSGALMLTEKFSNGYVKINGNGLSAGIYLCRIMIGGKEVQLLKLLKR